MLIRKNTKAFKTILHLFRCVQHRANREKFIRVYITRAGNSISDRISTEAIPDNAELYYNMTYETILNNLESLNRQLHVSDEMPGVYYFHSSLSKVWDESPFEFDELLIKEFQSLPELPIPRKKEKTGKFTFPVATTKTAGELKKDTKTKASLVESILNPEHDAKQPSFGLKRKIQFTDLQRVVFRQAKMNKLDVLNYYNQISDYLLPYLRDRPLSVRINDIRVGHPVALKVESLFEYDNELIPDWVKTKEFTIDKEQAQWMICNDKEHLLLCIERGCIEFNSPFSRFTSLSSPDYGVVTIDSPDSQLSKSIEVALTLKDILYGLQLPSFVMTDGKSGIQIHLPLSTSTTFIKCKEIAMYICKLVRLKLPDFVAICGMDNDSYGKVILDCSLNEEGHGAITPYSLTAVDGAVVNIATPLFWEEVSEGLKMEEFNTATIFKRLKQKGDPFANLYKKKIDSDALLERLKENYRFLF